MEITVSKIRVEQSIIDSGKYDITLRLLCTEGEETLIDEPSVVTYTAGGSLADIKAEFMSLMREN